MKVILPTVFTGGEATVGGASLLAVLAAGAVRALVFLTILIVGGATTRPRAPIGAPVIIESQLQLVTKVLYAMLVVGCDL